MTAGMKCYHFFQFPGGVVQPCTKTQIPKYAGDTKEKVDERQDGEIPPRDCTDHLEKYRYEPGHIKPDH